MPVIEKSTQELADLELTINYGKTGVAPSDNTSFYNKGMPVLFFFTGLHKDYHRPTDDFETINQRSTWPQSRRFLPW